MQIPDFMERNIPLARYSTLGVGGPAGYLADLDFCVVSDDITGVCGSSEPLLQACEFARDEGLDVFVLGGGSNVLFGDNGFRGLIIRVHFRETIKFLNNQLWVSSDSMVSSLVKLGKMSGFGGFEFLAGLPGTVGGAIYGNAGCYGGEFWDVVEEVVYFDGEYIQTQCRHSSMFGYRWSIFKEKPDWIILSARLKVSLKGKRVVAGETRRVHQKRLANQPKTRSAGCVFKNPLSKNSRISAGMLIDSAGLKGVRIGNAMISHEHGNFFVNLGGAQASDFSELIKIAKGKVHEKFGIMLEEEIIRVGES